MGRLRLPGARRFEMRGFGRTPLPAVGRYSDADDLEAFCGEGPVALVGASHGGLVCLQVAERRPQLVSELVLLDAARPDHDWSREVLDFAAEEERLVEQGDHRGAGLLNARFWTAAETPDEVRLRIAAMQERAFDMQAGSQAEGEEARRIELGAVRARTLVVVGEHDKPDFHAIADRLAAEIPGSSRATVAGAGHLPAMERPDETARVVTAFLE